ncbi:ATP-dependent DNA helicase RecG [Chitinimonas koreensis]|uniref:ATP-dependent DNA helicase RecG n=1 Tax=Chitinimonas koreensis TaxID=356302 RepID=UPI000403DBA3|nr:ATP-dependent DNA helicase RecG [Chitinimonas koreensis]QNM95857.1 ATP-dependent DNA helicase RecG [Chitinimonas koreensis]
MRPDFALLPKPIASRLAKLGLKRPFDLVLHLPLRYEDETHLFRIVDAPLGAPVLVEGQVLHAEVTFKPRRQLVARVADDSGELNVRLINFYPNQQQQLAAGRRVRLLGEIRRGFFGDEMVHPKVRSVGNGAALAEALTPVYPTVNGLAQPALRRLIEQALDSCELSDTLPPALLHDLGLMAFGPAVRLLHHPTPDIAQRDLSERTHVAWLRLKFDELLAQQLSMRLAYRRRRDQTAPVLRPAGALAARLVAGLPFGLTGAQTKVLAEIRRDLASPHPMQRLLQGDVGAGKTIVAALAALDAIEAGYQVALMAPTEILAEQHYKKLSAWLAPLGVAVEWVAGSLGKKQKEAAIGRVERGEARLAIGTHALFQDAVAFERLGLAIVDEQHRFGVHQRLALRQKAGGTAAEGGEAADAAAPNRVEPHMLMMSATPIPRTLAMSFYADLDVSVIDELPPGRTPIKTRLVNDARREEMIEFVRKVCSEGRQCYWVCPLIEESEALQLQTAIDTHAQLGEALPEYRVGLVHGRLKPAEKAEIMAAFARNELQALVATTVIEVGVDVPNATLMVIEHAERMGLAQLHQLRGRVGRGALESSCVLLYSAPLGDLAKQRLKVIFETTDGFLIAREDLRIRGPGEILGARQSGVPMLRFADLERDAALLERARDVAAELLERAPQVVDAHLERWLAGREELLKT